MSDAPDRESQTEEPTEKRLQEARDRGDLPISAEVPLAASITAMAALVVLLGASTSSSIAKLLGSLFEMTGSFRIDANADAHELLAAVALKVALFLAPIVGIMAFAGVAATFAQNTPSLAFDRLVPDLSRLSPMGGFSRIYGSRARVDLAKSAFKLLGGFVVVLLWFQSEKPVLFMATDYAADAQVELMLGAGRRLVIYVSLFCILIAGGDWFWAHARWRRQHRMTREEIKREHKESQGDPVLKGRMRALAMSRRRTNMMKAVPKATMIMANPTHLAIALRFVRSQDDAPVVVAKGKDLVALKIREIAALHGVPIIEDRPLARAMFDLVEIDGKIPQQFYKAVAVIIHHISRRGAVGFGPRV